MYSGKSPILVIGKALFYQPRISAPVFHYHSQIIHFVDLFHNRPFDLWQKGAGGTNDFNDGLVTAVMQTL